MNRVTSPEGEVTVKRQTREKFITKSDDAKRFAELSFLVRQFELDDYFSLDGTALMKEIYSKRRLDELGGRDVI